MAHAEGPLRRPPHGGVEVTLVDDPAHRPLPDPHQSLPPGTRLAASGRLNVRPSIPDANGKFGPVQSVLRSGTSVTLSEAPKSWQETGFVWAQISY